MKVNADLNLDKGTTKDELIAALDGIPGDAVVSIVSHTAGWNGTDWHTIKLTWEVGNAQKVYDTYRPEVHASSTF